MTIQEANQYLNDSNSGKITWDDNGRAAANNALKGTSVNMPTLDVSSIPSAVDYANSLNKMETGALDEYTKALQSQPSALDTYNKQEEAAGLPQLKKTASSLQGQVASLEDTLDRVEPGIRANSTNSLSTESQIQGQVDTAKQPIYDQLSKTNTALGRVSNAISATTADVGNKTQLILTDQQKALLPYEKKLQLVSDQASRLMTGFTQDNQTKLDILTTQYNAGVQLSLEQMREAHDLAMKEQDYQNTVKTMRAEGVKKETQVVEVGGHKYLVNMQTGEMQDLGSAKAPSSVGGSGIDPNKYMSNSNWSFV